MTRGAGGKVEAVVSKSNQTLTTFSPDSNRNVVYCQGVAWRFHGLPRAVAEQQA